MELKKIIEEIKAERPEITSVIFVGCGASQAELYPAKYLSLIHIFPSVLLRLYEHHNTEHEAKYKSRYNT